MVVCERNILTFTYIYLTPELGANMVYLHFHQCQIFQDSPFVLNYQHASSSPLSLSLSCTITSLLDAMDSSMCTDCILLHRRFVEMPSPKVIFVSLLCTGYLIERLVASEAAVQRPTIYAASSSCCCASHNTRCGRCLARKLTSAQNFSGDMDSRPKCSTRCTIAQSSMCGVYCCGSYPASLCYVLETLTQSV